jgi:hypothetical protein
MTGSWFDRYARITPYGITAAAVTGYLIAGGIWWGIPIVGAVALLYAAIRVGVGRRVTRWISRMLGSR